jgi:carbon storage regulator
MMIQQLSSAMRSMPTIAPQAVSRHNNLNTRLDQADLFTRSTAAQTSPRFGMLVLSRKKNESIVINNNVVITIVEIRGDKVRLGIVAPGDVPVHREEVHEAIHGTRRPNNPPT